MATSDESMDYDYRSATRKNASSDWEVPPYWYLKGDLCIRAIVSYAGVEEEISPSEIITLNQNCPNPVINEATISYTLPKKMGVRLKIYDITGKFISTLVDETQAPGLKKIKWNKRDINGKVVSSGIYFYSLSINGFGSFTKHMVVL